mmetsp:Transcript_54212/g.155832  ORF Transcript_54212/g.155832 Transcript_54212/m.155832 type:complete len:351 (-) Transcript_54212:668-1720(-)
MAVELGQLGNDHQLVSAHQSCLKCSFQCSTDVSLARVLVSAVKQPNTCTKRSIHRLANQSLFGRSAQVILGIKSRSKSSRRQLKNTRAARHRNCRTSELNSGSSTVLLGRHSTKHLRLPEPIPVTWNSCLIKVHVVLLVIFPRLNLSHLTWRIGATWRVVTLDGVDDGHRIPTPSRRGEEAEVNEATCANSLQTPGETWVCQPSGLQNGCGALDEIGIPQLVLWIVSVEISPNSVARRIEGRAGKLDLAVVPQDREEPIDLGSIQPNIVVDDPYIIISGSNGLGTSIRLHPLHEVGPLHARAMRQLHTFLSAHKLGQVAVSMRGSFLVEHQRNIKLHHRRLREPVLAHDW